MDALWTFDLQTATLWVVSILAVVQTIKRIAERVEQRTEPGTRLHRWSAAVAHGLGPVITAAFASLVSAAPVVWPLIKDGALSYGELVTLLLLLAGIGTSSSAGLYEVARRLLFPRDGQPKQIIGRALKLR